MCIVHLKWSVNFIFLVVTTLLVQFAVPKCSVIIIYFMLCSWHAEGFCPSQGLDPCDIKHFLFLVLAFKAFSLCAVNACHSLNKSIVPGIDSGCHYWRTSYVKNLTIVVH